MKCLLLIAVVCFYVSTVKGQKNSHLGINAGALFLHSSTDLKFAAPDVQMAHVSPAFETGGYFECTYGQYLGKGFVGSMKMGVLSVAVNPTHSFYTETVNGKKQLRNQSPRGPEFDYYFGLEVRRDYRMGNTTIVSPKLGVATYLSSINSSGSGGLDYERFDFPDFENPGKTRVEYLYAKNEYNPVIFIFQPGLNIVEILNNGHRLGLEFRTSLALFSKPYLSSKIYSFFRPKDNPFNGDQFYEKFEEAVRNHEYDIYSTHQTRLNYTSIGISYSFH